MFIGQHAARCRGCLISWYLLLQCLCSVLNFTYDEMEADIQGVKDWLVNECGIPAE